MRRVLMSAILMMSVLTGCLHVTYSTMKPRTDVTHSGTSHFFLWGLAGTGEVNVPSACPNGVAKVTVYKSFLDGFLGTITLGIYSPRSWQVWCS